MWYRYIIRSCENYGIDNKECLKIAETNYSYPLDADWTTEEIIAVIDFYNKVEKAYEKKVATADFLASYRRFKTIVPSKMEEKQIDKKFQTVSGYSIYRTVQTAKKTDGQQFSMEGTLS